MRNFPLRKRRLAKTPPRIILPAAGDHAVDADTLTAHHEAAHAVAMYRLGFGVRHLTMEPNDGLLGLCLPQRAPTFGNHDSLEGRAAIERYAIVLHAGNAADRYLRPEHPSAREGIDHPNLHVMLQWLEDDTAVEFAWCSYLWQRAYAFISDPRQWRFVKRVAAALLAGPRTLGEAAAMDLLTGIAAEVERDPTMPNAHLLGEPPVRVRSPWHAAWYSGLTETPFPRHEILASALAAHEPRARPQARLPQPPSLPGLNDVFSEYAAYALRRCGIRRLVDLRGWTLKSLSGERGVGRKTLREVREVAARHGIDLYVCHRRPASEVLCQ